MLHLNVERIVQIAHESGAKMTEKVEKTFSKNLHSAMYSLPKEEPAILIRTFLNRNLTKKAVGSILNMDSQDVSKMLNFKPFLGDPDTKGTWTAGKLKEDERYSDVFWTEDEVEVLIKTYPKLKEYKRLIVYPASEIVNA